jgi:tetratricopeptide (TPR) repeat protein
MPSHVCCEEHRRQLSKFADLSQLLPNIDMTNLAFYFARQCQNNKKAARAARRLTAISQRSTINDDKSTSPFHIVDRLLAAPTGIYGTEYNSRPYHAICTKEDLISSFERYVKALTLDDFNVIPYAFDIQFKYRSLSFLSKEQIYNRLMLLTRINLKETKINRVHKGSMIQVHAIVDPFITPRSIQSIVEDENGNFIRMAIYNWYTILADQSMESIRNRIKRERHFIIGNPFIKMAADGLLILRVDNPRLEMWCTDYEKEIEQMDADKLRDLGNKFFHNNEIYGAIEYYSLGLAKSPNDTRILSNRAECYLQGQLSHLALADCEHILDICTNNPTEENRDVVFTWKVHYRKMRALIGLQLFDQAKLSIDSLLECTQDARSTSNEIVERFRRILDCDIPRLQSEAEGNYDMFDLMSGRMRRSDEFSAEFERENVCEFRQCEKPVRIFLSQILLILFSL